MTRRVVRPHIITLPCPRLLADGACCEADVDVTLEYCPPEPERGERGGYVVDGVPDECANGHRFTAVEFALLVLDAERDVQDYGREDDR